jgi:Protein of unknown function (DUF3140)
MTKRRTSPDLDQLWEDFHASVNMSSHELRTWLLTQASNQGALPADPDPGLPAPGRDIVDVLGKRKVDVTDADLAVMSTVVERVAALRDNPPPAGAADTAWRHRLMDLGHDPLREPPERPAG